MTNAELGLAPDPGIAGLISSSVFCFSFLWARLLHELEADLKPIGILDSVPRHGGFRCEGIAPDPEDVDTAECDDYLGPTWMDDSCFCFAAEIPWCLRERQPICVACFYNDASLMQ